MTVISDRKRAERLLADNRKAHHDYHILHTYEAGIVLLGTEVKSIREGRVNLRDSFARVEGAEVFIYNIYVSPYSHRGYADHEPTRRRKLLLHKSEIRKLIGKTVDGLANQEICCLVTDNVEGTVSADDQATPVNEWIDGAVHHRLNVGDLELGPVIIDHRIRLENV